MIVYHLCRMGRVNPPMDISKQCNIFEYRRQVCLLHLFYSQIRVRWIRFPLDLESPNLKVLPVGQFSVQLYKFARLVTSSGFLFLLFQI